MSVSVSTLQPMLLQAQVFNAWCELYVAGFPVKDGRFPRVSNTAIHRGATRAPSSFFYNRFNGFPFSSTEKPLKRLQEEKGAGDHRDESRCQGEVPECGTISQRMLQQMLHEARL